MYFFETFFFFYCCSFPSFFFLLVSYENSVHLPVIEFHLQWICQTVTRCQPTFIWEPMMTFDEVNEYVHDVFCYLYQGRDNNWQLSKRFQLSFWANFRSVACNLVARGQNQLDVKADTHPEGYKSFITYQHSQDFWSSQTFQWLSHFRPFFNWI